MSDQPDAVPPVPETRVAPVTDANLEDFLSYCSLRGPEHDDSYLPGAGFRPDADHPSFLLLRDGES
ncbi:MAG: hypothetical protein GX430_12465, partial [Treponema sp.]|nr:hypothetical protein [Treponema sp.]